MLPATVSRGTTWVAKPSIERGAGRPGDTSNFEVIALDALVETPNGMTVSNCLAVLETAQDGSAPHTHYYAPNMGKVAVRGPDDWLFVITEFRPGSRSHGE